MDPLPEAPDESPRARSLHERVAHEVRKRPIAWVVFALFVTAGPVAVVNLFPEAPTPVAIVGGVIFGGYCAVSAVPQKFL